MSQEKEIKEISNKKLRVVIGIFVCLFSVILFINTTAFPRVFTFVFAYLFGFASYLVYIALYVLGMFLIFGNKKPNIRIPVTIVIGTVFVVLGAFTLGTQIAVVNSTNTTLNVGMGGNLIPCFKQDQTHINFASAYNKIFFTFTEGKSYLTADIINFFSNNYSVGAGFIGYFLAGCGNSLFGTGNGGFILGIILFALALILFATPIVLALLKDKQTHKGEKKVNAYADEIEDSYDEPIRPSYDTAVRDYKSPETPANRPQIDTNVSASTSSNFINDFGNQDLTNGTFVKPVFSIGDESADNAPEPIKKEDIIIEETVATPISQPVISQPAVQQVYEQPQPVPTPAPVAPQAAPAPQRVQLDESLVTAKPVFDSPVADVRETNIQQATATQQPEEVRRPRVNWVPPSTDLLDVVETSSQAEKNNAVADARREAINQVFEDFKIGARIESYVVGPSVTRFNVSYASNVYAKTVGNAVDDISIRLNGVNARFVPIVEGQSSSGLEIPNAAITMVTFKTVFEALPDVKKHPLAVAFGKNIQGDVIYADFDEFPHILVAGTTGSGKSIFVNSLIATLIMRNSPDDLRIVLVDPKKVEMTRYKDMPHLLCPIIYTAEDTLKMAKRLVEEMERRYDLFGNSGGATNIKEYNEDCEVNGNEKMPYIIFFLDEYADLIDQCKELSMPVVSLAQKARACGIHLLISTQRPSTNVVTGTIKGNLPTHVALMCSSYTDSMTIIGEGGAEKLLGKGDMLVQSPLISRIGSVRLQGCYASRQEITRVVADLKKRYETWYPPFFQNLEDEAKEAGKDMVNSAEFKSTKEGSEEEKYQAIKEWVMANEYMSISRMQRECAIGFNRAGRFFIRLQNEGVVDTVVDGNKGCRVLVNDKFGDDTPDVGSDEQSYFRSDD